jgi:hypothetical protein
MANGSKIDPKVAKGALAAAAAACATSDKSYRIEENFRDAVKAARDAGCSDDECAKIIGQAVLYSIDRYGGPASVEPKRLEEPMGLGRALSKIASRPFAAGFSLGAARRA